jgi:hypothetical protein
VVDSGASHLVLFRRTGLAGLRPALLVANGDARFAWIGTLPCLEVGGVVLRDPPAGTAAVARPEDGLLPLNLFRSAFVNAPAGYVILNPAR